MNEEFLWFQKYRPKTVNECILPDAIKSTLQSYVNKREIPNLILTGTQGVGKTSSVLALCKEVGLDNIFINGSSENGIDLFRTKITSYASSMSLQGGKKVIIIDEADCMSNSLQPALKAGMETFSKNVSFVMTCNNLNKIITPIHSRCSVINYSIPKTEKVKLISQFFKRICLMLDQEGIEYDKEPLATFISKWFPDYRRIINELQRYSSFGKIDVGVLTQIGDVQLSDLIKYLKEKNFIKTREWVVNNSNVDPIQMYRIIYDGLFGILKPSSIPGTIISLSEYQYKTSFGGDPEIHLMAFLTELMADGEFQ